MVSSDSLVAKFHQLVELGHDAVLLGEELSAESSLSNPE
jgi:hypothetical protein